MKQRSFHVQTFQRAVEKEDTTNTVLLNSGKRAKYEVYDPQEEENVDPKWRFNVEWTPAPEKRVIRITKEQEEQVLAHNDQLEKEKEAEEYIKGQVKAISLKSKAVSHGCIELNYEIRFKEGESAFVNALSQIEGISNAVLVSYNGDYMG